MDETWARLPTQTRPWVEACLETWPSPLKLVEIDGGSAALVRAGGSYDLAGHQLHEPTDAVWRDEAAARALAAELRRTPLRFRRLLADSPLLQALPRALVRPNGGSPVVRLDEAWAGPEGALSKKRASDIRRARRRAAAEGAVAFEAITPEPREVESLVARVAAVEDASWKGAAGTSLARDGQRSAFFVSYGRRTAEQGAFRCAFLTIGGVDAAAHLALEWRNAYWLFKIGFDSRFAHCSPGQLLMVESIRDAASRGLERYELLGAADPWTRMWTEEIRATVGAVSLPLSPAGALAAGTELLALARRKLR